MRERGGAGGGCGGGGDLGGGGGAAAHWSISLIASSASRVSSKVTKAKPRGSFVSRSLGRKTSVTLPNFSKALTRQTRGRGWCQRRSWPLGAPPPLPWSFWSTSPPPETSECAASPRGTRPPPCPCSTTGRIPQALELQPVCAVDGAQVILTARRWRTCGQSPGQTRSSAHRRRSWPPRCAHSLRRHRRHRRHRRRHHHEAVRGCQTVVSAALRMGRSTRGRRTGASRRGERDLDFSRSRRGGGLLLRDPERPIVAMLLPRGVTIQRNCGPFRRSSFDEYSNVVPRGVN